MKTKIHKWSIGAVIIACACFSVLPAMGQDYTIFKTFTATATNLSGSYTNADGVYPQTELVISNGVIYGTTGGGGQFGSGTIFKMNIDGSGYTVLKSLAAGALNTATSQFTNSEGQNPQGKLVLSGGWLYGSAEYGGTLGNGTIFKLDTNGGNFSVLRTFANGASDGANPRGDLVVSGGLLYGTTSLGGNGGGLGTLYRINTNGSGFTIIHNFTSDSTNGSQPNGVTLSGSTLYGTTYSGGVTGWGTVYKMNTNGTGFSQLKSFSAPNPPNFNGTNSDGARPLDGVTVFSAPLQVDRLFGTTPYGGASSNGVVFALLVTGSGFTNLHNFNALDDFYNNVGGANPRGKLVVAGNTVYGTAEFGADSGGGIFAVATDGSDSNMRWIFGQIGNDGRVPVGGLTLVGSALYGTTQLGGNAGNGTIFSLLLQVVSPLTIARSGANVILTWPTNDFTFNLQSTPVLNPPSWSAASPAPLLINGNNTVTNPITGSAKFYRLGP
jgi:uncharacterized repeat protein (TIGR03803 family)